MGKGRSAEDHERQRRQPHTWVVRKSISLPPAAPVQHKHGDSCPAAPVVNHST